MLCRKNHVVEARKFLKVLYLEVSGIPFINDECMHFDAEIVMTYKV